MAEEFTINSAAIESKINQLLPSQGGFAPGVDFSASTMVIPIVDLTETAEGSSLRQDLQTAFSHGTITEFNISNATTTIVNTTGYWRVFGNYCGQRNAATGSRLQINDGSTTKFITDFVIQGTSSFQGPLLVPFDFIIKLEAGDSLEGETSSTTTLLKGSVRQIADLSGNLVNP